VELIYREGGKVYRQPGLPGVQLQVMQDGSGRLLLPGLRGFPDFGVQVLMDAGELALFSRSIGLSGPVAPVVEPVVDVPAPAPAVAVSASDGPAKRLVPKPPKSKGGK